jgi:NDP-sugar pyrophosphorylase family protein
MIVAEIGDGGGCGLDIAYSFDGKELLGTAGALARALPLLGQEFYVLYGDSFLVDIDYRAAYEHFRRSDRLALMTVYRNRGRWELSNVHLRDGEIIRYDKRHPSSKMEHVDFGLGLLRKEALDGVPSGVVYDLGDLYHDLVARQQMAALEVGSRFYEVGSLAGLDEVRNYLEAGLGEADGLLY